MSANHEIKNGKERDILQQEYLKDNPYTLPQNYFAAVEDSVREKIHGKSTKESAFMNSIKTCIAFASVFAIIFGLGYGAMYVTGTTDINGNNNHEEMIYTQSQPVQISDTLDSADTDYIEQYLIESNISITTLASLE